MEELCRLIAVKVDVDGIGAVNDAKTATKLVLFGTFRELAHLHDVWAKSSNYDAQLVTHRWLGH